QGDDLSKNNTVAACAKHYVGYGAAIAGRDYNTVDMSLQLLHDVYLPPFKSAVDAGVATIMSAFNTLNGVPASGNSYLIRQVLKNEFGFSGFVDSDAGAILELMAHGYATDRADAGRLAINAGVDMDMGTGIYATELAGLIKNGSVSEKTLDDAVRRILTVKYKLGLFDDPYRYCDKKREKKDLLTAEHRTAARDLARQSIVLLKNDQHILPISKNIGKIAVIGPLADAKNDMLGCWSFTGDEKDAVSILDGIKSAVSPKTAVLYAKGCDVGSTSTGQFDDALKIAAEADLVVMAIGESGDMTGEAHSRADISIPGNQEELVRRIQATGKPLVILLANGRPLTIPWLAGNVSTLVETWFLGTEAGHAVADVLFGDYNPSGKLPVSFPVSVGQIPLYYSECSTGRPLAEDPGNIFRSRYIDSPNDALFPFGYGLSYTTFQYSNLKLSKPELTTDQTLEVSVDITNTGSRQGEEVAQLYIRDLCASVCQPVKVLKRFEKIALNPSETKTVTFRLQQEDLKFHNAEMKWVAEPGDFMIYVGGNSKEVLQASFKLL
ncbi:MAG: glycoside hydrolase family 3 C-terminal domain-containing protein, partial [Bacteroidota bacterium]|nr:glycoside hydrolase family 3 C-terminal domain-containing protein [Bacteroidota bacterium]